MNDSRVSDPPSSPPSLTIVSIYSPGRGHRASGYLAIYRSSPVYRALSIDSVQLPPLPSLSLFLPPSVYKIRTNRTLMNIHRNKGSRAIRISCSILYRASLLAGEVIYSNWRWRKKDERTNGISKT